MSNNGNRFAPLRKKEDFLATLDKYELPNLNNPERVNKRILKNLFYYQTNYFLIFIVCFILVGLINPGDFMIGLFSIVGILLVVSYASSSNRALQRLKQDNPIIIIAIVLFSLFILLKLLGSLMVFIFSVCLPLSIILVHASCRRRNFLNKVTNEAEKAGFIKTPMGVLLEYLGAAVPPNFLNSED